MPGPKLSKESSKFHVNKKGLGWGWGGGGVGVGSLGERKTTEAAPNAKNILYIEDSCLTQVPFKKLLSWLA